MNFSSETKAGNVRFRPISFALAITLAWPAWARPLLPGASQESSFTDRTATALLGEIVAGMTAHNPQRMLGVFDLGKMGGGLAFRQQVVALFSQTTVLRIHFNQVHTSMEDGRAVATAEVEVEAQFGDEWTPPLHKQAQLRLVAETSGGKWKFTDVQPRTFFSTQP
jgi:hypothetical protein